MQTVLTESRTFVHLDICSPVIFAGGRTFVHQLNYQPGHLFTHTIVTPVRGGNLMGEQNPLPAKITGERISVYRTDQCFSCGFYMVNIQNLSK